jgi:O-acetyl-ADP-ribose deacetylase (regulator of RNase III)
MHVVVDDLASVAADAVVRPATTTLEAMTPALQRLDALAGPRFIEACRVSRELGVGSAVVTAGGDLLAELVIHAVVGGPDGMVSPEAVRRAVAAALWQCTQWNIETLALPAVAAEPERLAAGEAADALVSAVREHQRNARYPATVIIVAGDASERDLYTARIGQGD